MSAPTKNLLHRISAKTVVTDSNASRRTRRLLFTSVAATGCSMLRYIHYIHWMIKCRTNSYNNRHFCPTCQIQATIHPSCQDDHNNICSSVAPAACLSAERHLIELAAGHSRWKMRVVDVLASVD